MTNGQDGVCCRAKPTSPGPGRATKEEDIGCGPKMRRKTRVKPGQLQDVTSAALNEVGVKLAAHSTLQAAGVSQRAVWGPLGERAHTQPLNLCHAKVPKRYNAMVSPRGSMPGGHGTGPLSLKGVHPNGWLLCGPGNQGEAE